MARIIKFEKRSLKAPDNIITSTPWEFRRALWKDRHFIQILKEHLNQIEYQNGNDRKMPPHFVLKGGMAHTIHGIYIYRNDHKKMRELYFLAGLIDCMINQINPILRTDLIRDMYKKIQDLKNNLKVNWYGHIDHVLFPIDVRFYNHQEYEDELSRSKSLKEIYNLIRKGTNEMFDILSTEYVFFTPGDGG